MFRSLIDEPAPLFAVMFLALLLAAEIGCRLARLTSIGNDEELHVQIVAARDAIGLLLSLLLAFTLAMVLPRFTLRKQLIVDEANAIGTTWLRAQLLTEPARSNIMGLLRTYVDARTAFTEAGLRQSELQAALSHAKQVQNELWEQTVEAAQFNPTFNTANFIQSLNQAIDVSEERLAAQENRVPGVLWSILIFMSLLACFMVGCSMRRRFLLVMILWPLMISTVLALNADLDSPRAGFIQVNQESIKRLQEDFNGVAGRRK
jgi:hypothetical protein